MRHHPGGQIPGDVEIVELCDAAKDDEACGDAATGSVVGAGGQYRSWWWEGTGGGMVLLTMCGLAVTNIARAQQKETPTRTYRDEGGS